jgi:Cys-tRNA(Pro)/Cys-tRNA(Cys) deacylase
VPTPLRQDRPVAKKSSRGGTPATVALTRAGVAFTTHSYEHDPAATSYGLEAAHVLGLPPEQVFKTLLADVDGALVVAIVPVGGRLDLKALAAAVGGKKAAMADPHVAERTTGYVVGGISPLGQRKELRTVLDETALAFATVYVSGGRRGFDLGLSPTVLVEQTKATTAPLARD